MESLDALLWQHDHQLICSHRDLLLYVSCFEKVFAADEMMLRYQKRYFGEYEDEFCVEI